MTGLSLRRTASRALVVIIVAMAGAALGGVSVSAASPTVSASCAGNPGGAAYVTDTGLTVYENDSTITYGNFPDGQTVDFGAVTLSAPDTAQARLDNSSDTHVCLGDVRAGTAPVTVSPDNAPTLVVASDASVVAYRDPVYNVSDPDLAYDHSATVTITLVETNLSSGRTIIASDIDSGAELARSDTDASGTVSLSLPSGTHVVDLIALQEPPTANDVSVSTDEDSAVTSDFDVSAPNPDSLTYSVTSDPNNGTVEINGDSFTYTPDSGYSGPDSFTYQVSDEISRSDTAVVSVVVAEQQQLPPVIGDQSPQDPDGDGLYEDVNGDGTFNIVDIQALFANLNNNTVQNNTEAFDFNGDGRVNVVDVQRLFNEL